MYSYLKIKRTLIFICLAMLGCETEIQEASTRKTFAEDIPTTEKSIDESGAIDSKPITIKTTNGKEPDASGLPCVNPNLSLVSPDVKIKMCDGDVKSGTLKICSSDGETNCLIGQGFITVKKTNIDPTKIKKGIRIANIAGVSQSIPPEHLHVNASGGDIAGRLKSSCRSTSNLALWNVTATLSIVGSDTLSDSGYINPDKWWTSGDGEDPYYCDGSHYKDASRLSDTGGKTTCVQASQTVDCMLLDETSGLFWTESNPGNVSSHPGLIPAAEWPCGKDGCTIENGNVTIASGTTEYSASESMNWFDAMYWCDQLTFGGRDDWRVPTFKESQQLVVYGATNFFTDNPGFEFGTFWTSTTVGADPNKAWDAGTSGQYFARSKASAKRVICVSGGLNR